MKKIRVLTIGVFVLALFFGGCASYDAFLPKAMKDLNGAIKKAQLEGAEKKCPKDFQEVVKMRDDALKIYYSCRTEAGIEKAKAAKEKADALCPKVDSDGDGVLDNLDKCPGTLKGVKVDSKGCPLDTDGDGIFDYVDKCPGTPKNTKVDKNGCPPVGEELLILTGINFAFDSAKLDKPSETIIDRAVQNLKRNPKMTVLIEGHTDSIGPEDYNMGLSVRRARAVKDYMVSQGIAKERLSVKGFGESQPLVSNDTKEGRAQNRRVEFVVTAK